MQKIAGKPKSKKQAEILSLLRQHGEMSRVALQSLLSWQSHRVSLLCIIDRMKARNMITVEHRNEGRGVEAFYKPVSQ